MQEVDLTYGAPLFDVVPDLLVRLKASLKLSSNSFDVKLTQYIKQSIELIGRYTGRILVQCQVTGRFNKPIKRDPDSHYPSLYFPVAPVARDAFVSLKWSDGVNTDEALTGFVMPRHEQGYVYITGEPSVVSSFGSFENWLCSKPTELYPLVAVIKAGYGQNMSVWQCPLALQQAIISLSTYFYDNPSECGGCSSGSTNGGVTLPHSVAQWADLFKIRRVF